MPVPDSAHRASAHVPGGAADRHGKGVGVGVVSVCGCATFVIHISAEVELRARVWGWQLVVRPSRGKGTVSV